MFAFNKISITVKRVNPDLFSLLQRLVDSLLFDALNAEIGKSAHHIFVVDFQRAHSLLAAFFTDQRVRMRSIREIFCYTGNYDHGSTAISDNLKLKTDPLHATV